jgi:hypothetical protein
VSDLDSQPDVDGVPVVPPTVLKLPTAARNGATHGETPLSNGKVGGQPPPPVAPVVNTASTVKPNSIDELPDLIRAEFEANGQAPTGYTYAGEMKKFLSWLKAHGLAFDTMVPGTAERFLVETIPNSVTRNRGVVALKTLFEKATALGFKFTPQEMSRTSRKSKKTAPETAPVASAVGGSAMSIPAPAVLDSTAQPYTQPYTQPTAAAPVAAPKPAAPAPAFPSLGQRVRICKIAGATEPGIPPGTPIPIGMYPKALVEADGSLDNFIMQRVRPMHGPRSGEGAVLYRVENLDTSGRPLPGQYWDVPVLPDINGVPVAPQMGVQPQPMVMMGTQFQPQPAAQPQNGGAGAAMERMVEMAFRQQESAQARYDQLLTTLSQQKQTGQIDQTTFMLLAEKYRPEPLDLEKLKREFRAELVAAQPPPTNNGLGGMDPMLAASLFTPQQPKADPAMDRIAAMMEKQAEFNNQMMMRLMSPPPAPQQRDPMEIAMAMVTMMNAQQQKSDPVKDQLAALTLQKLSDPPKSSGLAEAVQNFQMIRELTGGGESRSALDGVLETINVMAENADKLGTMFGKMKGAAMAGALQPRNAPVPPPTQAQQRRALPAQTKPAAPAPAKPKQPQMVQLPPAGQEKFRELIKSFALPPEEDQKLVVALYEVLQSLDELGDPWKKIGEAIRNAFINANSVAEIQALVVRLFQLCGAVKVLSTPDGQKGIARLTEILHINYSAIYAGLTEGQEKTIADAPQAASADAAPAEGEPVAEGEESAEGEGGDDEEEGDEAEPETEPAPATTEPETK